MEEEQSPSAPLDRSDSSALDGSSTEPPAPAVLGSTPDALPDELLDLYDLLSTGAGAGLVARSSSSSADSFGGVGELFSLPTSTASADAQQAQRPPIQLIAARQIDGEEAWCEWVVTVQVRSSAAGAVKKLATLVGDYVSFRPCSIMRQRLNSSSSAAAQTHTNSHYTRKPSARLSRRLPSTCV